VVAILGGAGAAVAWAVGALCAARLSRTLGSMRALAWVMVLGLLLLVPALVFSHRPHVDGETMTWLVLSGIANVAGLLMVYRALGTGRIGVVAPIVSAEGAVTAALAIVAGQAVGVGQAMALAAVVGGVILIVRQPDDDVHGGADGDVPPTRAAIWAGAAAGTFGCGLYFTGRAAADVPVVWAVLPPRLIGVVVLTLPLAVAGRMQLPRAIAPIALLGAICEVAGFLCYAAGAEHDIAIAAVLASTTGAVAAGFAWLVHSERLTRIQVTGVAVLTLGVALLSALTA